MSCFLIKKSTVSLRKVVKKGTFFFFAVFLFFSFSRWDTEEGNKKRKMFFHIWLEKELKLHPRYFGPNIRTILMNRLVEEVEGTCSGRYGYIIFVTGGMEIGTGFLDPASGFASYPVKYQAIVFRPFKGEVIDVVVTNACESGFFAEAGPLRCFISSRFIPNNLEFDPESHPQAYVSKDASETERLTVDSVVRIKIIGTRLEATSFYAIGTMKEDYLGLIS